MKTIATAAVLLMLTTAAWADEAQNEQAKDPANSNEPIVLSEAEMDGVTAGISKSMDRASVYLFDGGSTSSSRSIQIGVGELQEVELSKQ